jgi:hypothetical protein
MALVNVRFEGSRPIKDKQEHRMAKHQSSLIGYTGKRRRTSSR